MEDVKFVNSIAAHFGHRQAAVPVLVLANQRCGSWYVDPRIHSQAARVPVYFKSTDGHSHQWNFNLRRANWKLLSLLVQHEQQSAGAGAVILVDSTRHGKRLPDSFSRTVPIWCATLNYAARQAHTSKHHHTPSPLVPPPAALLHTLPSVVSMLEHEAMAQRIPEFAKLLLDSPLPVHHLTPLLFKPLRPLWITPCSISNNEESLQLLAAGLDSLDFTPVICLSASRAVKDGWHDG